MRRSLLLIAVVVLSTWHVSPGAQVPGSPLPGIPRDAARPAAPQGTASLRGRVVQLDTGQAVRRAQVTARALDAAGQPHTATTDAEGRFEIARLPAGRYMVSAGRGGFVTIQHGQRRPLEPGRPLVLADGQALDNVTFSLPRGSVIVGQVVDEYGDPVTGANVQVERYRYVNGRRQLVPAGADPTTDDRGQFRIFGLMPGEYYLSASPPGGLLAAVTALASSGGVGQVLDAGRDSSGYARTYYPGTPSASFAQPVAVGVGEESPLLIVPLMASRLSTVSGMVLGGEDGKSATQMVMLRPRNGDPTNITNANMAPVTDGRFTLAGVAPGEYTVEAMMVSLATMPPQVQYGATDIVVGSADLADVVVTVGPGAAARGRVTFEGGAPADLRPNQVDLGAPGATTSMAPVQATVRDDWTFEITGLRGTRTLRVEAPAPWTLRRITRGGADVTDLPIDFSATVDDLTIVLTQRATDVSGAVTDGRAVRSNDYVVVWFADDRARWLPQTRFIRTARPEQDGRYRIRGLPPGRYLAIALEYLEPGEELDPERLEQFRRDAVRIDLGDGETRALDLRLSGL